MLTCLSPELENMRQEDPSGVCGPPEWHSEMLSQKEQNKQTSKTNPNQAQNNMM